MLFFEQHLDHLNLLRHVGRGARRDVGRQHAQRGHVVKVAAGVLLHHFHRLDALTRRALQNAVLARVEDVPHIGDVAAVGEGSASGIGRIESKERARVEIGVGPQGVHVGRSELARATHESGESGAAGDSVPVQDVQSWQSGRLGGPEDAIGDGREAAVGIGTAQIDAAGAALR